MEQRNRIRQAAYGVVVVSGAAGLVSAAYGGRVLVWAIIGALSILIHGIYLTTRGVKPRPPQSPGLMLTALVLAPFVNDLALRSPPLYLSVVLGLGVAIIAPRIQYRYLRRTP